MVSSSQTFYYLIWKNSKKVTKNSKKPKQNCQKVSQNMLTSAEGLSKFAEGLSSHYLQLFFPFILCTISFYLFSLYSLYNCVLYNYDFLLCSSSEWNKNQDMPSIVLEKTLILSQALLRNQALSRNTTSIENMTG